MRNKLFEMPVDIVREASKVPNVLSIIADSKKFSALPTEELVFILLSVISSVGEVNQEVLDLMYSFVNAYEDKTIVVEKDPSDSMYTLYQTGKIEISLGFARKNNIQV